MQIKKLVRKAQRGDKEALLQLVLERKDEYYRLAYSYLRHEEDAMDALEDMIVILYEKISRLNKSQSFYSWSKTILVNECHDILRKRKKTTVLKSNHEHFQEKEGETSIYKLDVKTHLEQLNKDQQEAIQLRYWLDYDYETIARLTNVPLGTVKSRISTGLKKLKEHLGGEYL
ncbi:RNA polymerase sigma factor [Pseudalkalibacillus berkeleyi]|uniref:RNA polymerase sigma factor n=1 Tax=Pseudalkalibacillus berkeleyi TaxID=1069813 RepID=A0ABS9H5F0_9BACL|nr:sigma-70 family RNA polymerase sigma factor [Pseudalkalibacillus berkeleyi]MCF6139169.1 RNA polymerase sigma factor [Pseudalkalibacillus berkeleyi]